MPLFSQCQMFTSWSLHHKFLLSSSFTGSNPIFCTSYISYRPPFASLSNYLQLYFFIYPLSATLLSVFFASINFFVLFSFQTPYYTSNIIWRFPGAELVFFTSQTHLLIKNIFFNHLRQVRHIANLKLPQTCDSLYYQNM